MLRKIIGNLFAAFVIYPVISMVRSWRDLTKGIYRIEDAYYNTFWDYLQVFLHEIGFPWLQILFLVIILWPFQYVKDRFARKGKPLAFLVKCLVFMVIMMIWLSVFIINVLSNPFPGEARIYFWIIFGSGIVFPFILYLLVDLYTEKQERNNTPASPEDENDEPQRSGITDNSDL